MTLIRTSCGGGDLEIFFEDDPFEVDGIEYDFYQDADDSFHARLMFEMAFNPCSDDICSCHRTATYMRGVVWSKVMSDTPVTTPGIYEMSG